MSEKSDALITTLVLASHDAATQAAERAANMRERHAFLQAFEYGLKEGAKRQQRRIRQTLSVEDRVYVELEAEAYWRHFKAQEQT